MMPFGAHEPVDIVPVGANHLALDGTFRQGDHTPIGGQSRNGARIADDPHGRQRIINSSNASTLGKARRAMEQPSYDQGSILISNIMC